MSQKSGKKRGHKSRYSHKRKAYKRNHNRMTQSVSHMVATRMNINKTPFKRRFSCRLRYVETVTFTTGTLGALGTQQAWSLNSVYDPNNSGTGHQPYLFDTISALYSKYRVNAAKVTMNWCTIGSTADLMGAYTVNGDTGGATLTGMTTDRAAEINNVSTILISPSGNQRVVSQKFYAPIHKIIGVSRSKYNAEDNYSAPVGQNPLSGCYLAMSAGSPTGVASEAISCQVIIDYYVTFWDAIVQAQS